MKFKWKVKEIASMTFHLCMLGEVCVGQVVESQHNKKNNKGVGWQLYLRTDEYNVSTAGRQLSIAAAKIHVEDAAEEWFRKAGVKV